MNDIICTREDDFLEDKPRWVAELSNAQRVLQDDDRPGLKPPQAWYRLHNYLRSNNLRIRRLYLQNRSHVEFPLPENASGYFFCKKVLASLNTSVTIHSYIVGFQHDDFLYLSEWQVPELIELNREQRHVSELQHPEWLISQVATPQG